MIQWSSKSFNQEILPPGAWAVGMRVASQRWPGKFHSLRIPCVPWACLGASTLRQKNWLKWWWPHPSRAKWSFNKPHLQKTQKNLQVASSNFPDDFWFSLAPVISRCLFCFQEALRGIFLSANKPYNEMMDSNAILPDGKMHGARGPEGPEGQPYRFVSWLGFMFMYMTVVYIYNYIYCSKLLYIYIYCYIVIFYYYICI